MPSHRDLKLLELVDQIVADVTLLATGGSTRLLFKSQLLDSVESVSANIGEAFGRGTKPDRNRALFVARGEAEEAIRHLLPIESPSASPLVTTGGSITAWCSRQK